METLANGAALNSAVALVVRVAIGAILLLAGIAKVRQRGHVEGFIQVHLRVPATLAGKIEPVLIMTELVVGGGMLLGVGHPFAAIAAVILFALFAAVHLLAVAQADRGVDCGCFGGRKERLTLPAGVRNLALAAAATSLASNERSLLIASVVLASLSFVSPRLGRRSRRVPMSLVIVAMLASGGDSTLKARQAELGPVPLLRVLHSAQTESLRRNQRYLPLKELVEMDSFEEPFALPIRTEVRSQEGPWTFTVANRGITMIVSADAHAFAISIQPNAPCGEGWYTDTSGTILRAKALDCE